MLQANQQAIAQEANINIIHIRQLEIQYFSNFFSSFATQAALIAGFTSSVLSSEAVSAFSQLA
jgi:hypothetical protein